MRHFWTPSGTQAIEDHDDVNPEEDEETRAGEKEYRLKLTLGGVLLGLGKLLIICILVTMMIVFITSLVVVGSKVGFSGFIDFTVGLLTGYYSVLSPGDVPALRGDLELVLFFEFLFLLLLGLYMIAALRLGSEGSARTTFRMGMRGRPGFPAIGKSQDTGQKDRRMKARRGLGIEVILVLVAVFIAIALLFGFV